MVLSDPHSQAKLNFSCLLGTLVAIVSARSMGDSLHLFGYYRVTPNFKLYCG